MLNPAQQQAVHAIKGPCLVLAGAGSGKTRVITEKIAYLLRQGYTDAKNIYAVTFTNKAAREMLERVAKVVDPVAAEKMSISTFHTLGMNIIRQEYKALGLSKQFSLFDDQDTLQLIQDLAGGNKAFDKSQARQVQSQISRWKSAMVSPKAALVEVEQAGHLRLAARLYERYQEQLRAYHALDFDDLIVLPTQLLQDSAEVRTRWQAKVGYLLVDEYQDTNTCQYQLMYLLVKDRKAFTVVGDDDQSIYAWRGAQPENLALLQLDFPTLQVIKLEQNYRSTAVILQAANQLISHNPHIFDKALQPTLGHGDAIRVMHTNSAEAEAERVAMEISSHQFQHKIPYHHYAILYRGNHQALLFEQALRGRHIPYKLNGGTSFFARAEIKDVLAYCRLLANPQDDAAFIRIINTPRREVGPTTLQKLADYARERQVALFNAIDEIGLESVLPERAVTRLRSFAAWLATLRTKLTPQHVETVLRELLDSCSYYAYLEEQAKQQKTAEFRIQYVDEFVGWLGGYAKKKPDLSFAQLIQAILLRDRQEEDQSKNHVQLMTLHAAKGLEFPNVYLVGFEERLLPHQSSLEEDNVEEERRIAYVGITRAQRNLTLTLAKVRKRFGEKMRCEPSRFLDELPQDLLVVEGNAPKDAEEQQQTNQNNMAQLKAMFGKTDN